MRSVECLSLPEVKDKKISHFKPSRRPMFQPPSLGPPSFPFKVECRVCRRWRTRRPGIRICIYLSIYVSMYVCIYVSMHLCIYVSIYVYIYVSMYVCMYVCMYLCIYVCMYVRMYVSIYVCMYVFIYVCVYVCVYIYIYIYTCRRWRTRRSGARSPPRPGPFEQFSFMGTVFSDVNLSHEVLAKVLVFSFRFSMPIRSHLCQLSLFTMFCNSGSQSLRTCCYLLLI